MADSDIRTVLNKLDKDNTNRVRSYMVGPNINEREARLWEGKKITPIKMSFEAFINEIDKAIDQNTRRLSSLKIETSLPIYAKFHTSIEEVKPTENFISFITNNIDYVHSNMNSPNTDPKEFYKGFFNNWDPIIKNLDVERKIKDGFLFEVLMDDDQHNSNDQFFYLLKGNAGSGKSVLLKRIAYDGANTLERFCIVLKDDMKIYPEQIIELANYVKERIYLFIDNVSLLEDEIIYLLKKAKKDNIKLTIIGAERLNVWNIECQDLANYLSQSYHIKYLGDSEILELLNLLDRHNALYTLKNKTAEERVKAFSEKAGRELLVALYEATNSKPFEEIIYDEYKSINDARAQSLYLTVSIFHKIGSEARAGFISRVHNISFHEFKEKLFKPLAYIVFDKKNNKINDYVYLTRNRLIAEIVFEKVLTTPQDCFDEYVRILNNLNIDYESDRMAFMSIVNGKKLIEVFPDPLMIRKIYQIAMEVSKDDPKLYQQQAIFEMNANGGSVATAEKHLKSAYELLPGDPYISHTFAEMLLKKAEKSRLDTEFFSYIDEVIDVCNSIIKKGVIYSHPYHTSLKAYILKLKKVLAYEDSPAIERCLKDIEKVLASAKQYFLNDQFLLEIESSFNELIKDTHNARELLEKAFNTNKSSPFIALRLANFYDREGELEKALGTINEALAANSGDKDLNFKYAMLLEKTNNPSYDDIKYYLRRAFTKGDSRFQAQFWHARALYLTNEIAEAKQSFKALSTVSISPDIKNSPSGIIKSNNKPFVFSGNILKVEISYGFVRRDGISDDIFFYKFDNDKLDWESLKRGQPVTFLIAFNYKGAIAINMELS
jgi:cold shock CspA family protein